MGYEAALIKRPAWGRMGFLEIRFRRKSILKEEIVWSFFTTNYKELDYLFMKHEYLSISKSHKRITVLDPWEYKTLLTDFDKSNEHIN
jgi:hypothetical protein